MNGNHIIYFNTRDELSRINFADVMYFEADSNYVNVALRNSHTLSLLSSLNNIEAIVATLPSLPFLRLGRKYIINLDYLTHINIQKAHIILSDSTSSRSATLSVSRDSLRALKQSIKETHPRIITEFKTSNCKMEAFFESQDCASQSNPPCS